MDELIGLAIQAAEKSAARKRQSRDSNAVPRVAAPPRPAVPPLSAPPNVSPTQTLRPVARPTAGLREMFQDGNSLLRAVIAAEVLGPPRALQESHYWQASRANESSNLPD